MILMFICLFAFPWIPAQAHVTLSLCIVTASWEVSLPPLSSHFLYIVSIVTNSKRNLIQIFVWLKKKRKKNKSPCCLYPLHPKQNPCSSLNLNLNFNTIHLYAQKDYWVYTCWRYTVHAQSPGVSQYHKTKSDFKQSIPKKSRTLVK